MSHRAVEWALGMPVKNPTHKLALVKIAAATNEKTGVCWLSIKEIAAAAQACDRTAQRAVRAFQALGWLQVEARRRDNGAASSNLYRLFMTPARDTAMSPAPRHSYVTGPLTQGVTPNRGFESEVEPEVESTSPLPAEEERGRAPHPTSSKSKSGKTEHRGKNNTPSQPFPRAISFPDFVHNCADLGKPLTKAQIERAQWQLEKCVAMGLSPGDVIAQAIEGGWRNFFPAMDAAAENAHHASQFDD